MSEYSVDARVQVDNTSGLVDFRKVPATSRQRVIALHIKPKGNHFSLRIQPGGLPDFMDALDDWEADIPLTREQLWGHVKECRKVWRESVVDHRRREEFVFHNHWNFVDDPTICNEVLGQAALAGNKLFRDIFLPNKRDTGERNYKKLTTIGEALRDKMSKGNYWFPVVTDKFHAPWNLIYSDRLTDKRNGTDARLEGFWGYQHIVEQVSPTSLEYGAPLTWADPLNIALQLDETIDDEYDVECNALVDEHFQSYCRAAVKLDYRNNYDALADALCSEPLVDHILYFCCHGMVDGDSTEIPIDTSYLRLTDCHNPISPGDFDRWIGETAFDNHPIVFLNACESANMNSVFYDSFFDKFLDYQANAVVGTSTEIPAIFAGQFAQDFFEDFFRGGMDSTETSKTIGEVMFALRRHFVDVHNNPLGLLYSVYRGADTYLEKQVPKRPCHREACVCVATDPMEEG